jgi:hypothetical protein
MLKLSAFYLEKQKVLFLKKIFFNSRFFRERGMAPPPK